MEQHEFRQSLMIRTSSMAIVSIVSGLSFFFGIPIIGSVVAVATGNMAMKEIVASNGTVVGENYARLGLITGWFGIGVWGLGIICGVLTLLLGLTPVVGSICVGGLQLLGNLAK